MKLRILCHYYGPANCMPESPMYSWAVRELGAEVCYFNPRNAPPGVRCAEPEDLWKVCEGCDVAAYFGTMPGSDIDKPINGECPSLASFLRAKEHCKLVGVFGDGGCPMGKHTVKQYAEADAFDAMACIDGSVDWNHRPQDFVCWGLFDPKPYEKAMPRTRKLGFNGAWSMEREAIAMALGPMADVVLGYEPMHPVWRYQDFADWMLSTRSIFNTSWTSFAFAKNSKGRVNEAALAGCLVFETAGSATRNWFTPGEEYLEYADPLDLKDVPAPMTPHQAFLRMQDPAVPAHEMEDMERRKRHIRNNAHLIARDILAVVRRPDFDGYAEAIGARMRARVLRDYGPEKFWKQVCA